jgi:CO dehydrogenase maturation factor
MVKLIKDYDYIVIDNEAGLEHLSRRTTRTADVLIVITEATPVGLKAAKRIGDLAKELDIKTKKELLIINFNNKEIEKEKIRNLNLEYLGSVPRDSEIEKISSNGAALMKLDDNATSIRALKKIFDRIL